ncbi:MAG: DUF2325 domain-containing protein [Deltaproteobacteria bacterium]
MKTSKRIWELQTSTICKIVGMALDVRDLRKIARKFGISRDDPLMDEEFVLHTTVVQLCNTDNAVSRYTEKIVARRFEVHAKKLPLENPFEMIERVRSNPAELQAPLWAVLWSLATRGRLAHAKLESSLFGFVHMLEHRLLREYWNSLLTGEDAAQEEEEKDKEILRLKRSLLDMQWANGKLEKVVEGLRIRVASTEQGEAGAAHVADAASAHRSGCRCANGQKLCDLKALLAQEKVLNRELETEIRQLKEEIDALVSALRREENEAEPGQHAVRKCACPFAVALQGKKVTLVGGIESLECHYRDLIESLGGRFCRHNGNSSGGDKGLEDCIVGSDLVVCPIEVTSHNAARSVKKMCRTRGVPCCFPRSASITALKKAVEEHYAREQVA